VERAAPLGPAPGDTWPRYATAQQINPQKTRHLRHSVD